MKEINRRVSAWFVRLGRWIIDHSAVTLFFTAVAVYALVLDRHLWSGGDDAWNLLAVKSHLDGFGWRLFPAAHFNEYTSDRGYLIVLSLLYRLAGDSYYWLKLPQLLAAAGSVSLLYQLCRQHRLAWPVAFSAAILLLTSYHQIHYMNILIPETPVMFLTLLVGCLGEYYFQQPKLLHPVLGIIVLAGAWLFSIGNCAQIAPVALALTFLFRDRRRFLKLVALPFILWIIFSAQVIGYIGWYADLAGYLWATATGGDYSGGNIAIYRVEGLGFGRYLYNLAAYGLKYIPAQIFPPFTALSYREFSDRIILAAGYLAGAAVTGVIFRGLWVTARRPVSPVLLTVLTALLVLVPWYVIEGGRFLFIVLPFLLFAFVAGCSSLTARKVAKLYWCGFILLAGYQTVILAREINHVEPEFASYEAAVKWIVARGGNPYITCRKPHPLFYGYNVGGITGLRTAEDVSKIADGYIIADAYSEWNRTILRELIVRSGVFREVYRTGEPTVIVYERLSVMADPVTEAAAPRP